MMCIIALSLSAKLLSETYSQQCPRAECQQLYQKAYVDGYWRPIFMLERFEWLDLPDGRQCLAIAK